MATRFYLSQTTSDISPAIDAVWDAGPAVRRELTLTKESTGADTLTSTKTGSSNFYHCAAQYITPLLASISAVLAVSKAAFRCYEVEKDDNASLHLVFRKCDDVGGNLVTIGSITDDTELVDGSLANRFVGASNLTDQSFSEDDRLIVEVGVFFNNTKNETDVAYIHIIDNNASDLPENDTETAAYNCWIETGDTFAESGGVITRSIAGALGFSGGATRKLIGSRGIAGVL